MRKTITRRTAKVHKEEIIIICFFDFLNDLNNPDWSNYESAGLEIYTDWHFLGLPAIFTLGGRYSNKLGSGDAFEFLFGLGY